MPHRAHQPQLRTRGLGDLVATLLRPYRGWVALILGATALDTAVGLAAPWPLKIVLDNVIEGRRPPAVLVAAATWLPGNPDIRLAAVAGLLTIAIAALGAVASWADNYFTESVGQWIANDLRVRVYHHLEHLSLAYYDTHPTGALISTISDDIDTIQDFAASSTLTILVDVLAIVGMLGIMFSLNWDFTLIAIAVSPFLLLLVRRFRGAVKKATREVRRRQSELLEVVHEGLTSMRVISVFGRQDREEERLQAASRAAVKAALQARRVKSLLSPTVSVVVACCTAFVLYRGASLVVSGAMTLGSLTVFLAYLAKFFKPVQELAKLSGSVAQAAVAVERVRGILDVDMSIPERPDARDPGSISGTITFDHVAFGYEPARPVLKDVSFSIRAGQSVGIVGTSGSGKSTLASLVARLYDVTGGRVLLDGVDLRHYKLNGLRQQFAFVLQETVLFRGTILDNIAYGRPGATVAEVIEAAKLANAHEFVSRLPKGYETVVGERGLTLSGGERQRIGIARALIRNAPILILDEPTSGLDLESERVVVEALERLMEGRTVITIAHRLSTLRRADSIVVLDGGRVAEKGTHDELLRNGSVYAKLHLLHGAGSRATHDSGRRKLHAVPLAAGAP